MRLFKRGVVWFCSFYDARGKRRRVSTRCHDRRAAEAVARRWEQVAADPASAAKAAATVEDALDDVLEMRREQARAGKRAQATVGFYEQKAGVLVHVLGGAESLAGLNALRMDRYVTERRMDGASDHTIHKELGVLRVALKLAKRRGKWAGDVDAVLPPISSGYAPKDRTLVYDELPRLLAQLDLDDAARTAFSIATGAELGATERARREDVKDGEVLVRGTKREARHRVVPVVTAWQRQLLAYALEHAQGEGGLLFKHGGAEWRSALKYAARRAKMDHVSPNDLRRTAATWLRADGAPIELLSPFLGHVDGRMAERVYARLSPAALRDLLAKATGNWDTGGTDGGGPKASSGTQTEPNLLKLAPRAGLEPATRGLTVRGLFLPRPRSSYETRSERARRGTRAGQREAGGRGAGHGARAR